MRTDVTRENVRELLEELHPGSVFAVEDGTVWVSGMNSGCHRIARDMAHTLVKHDIPTDLVRDDGAARFGGVEFNYGDAA